MKKTSEGWVGLDGGGEARRRLRQGAWGSPAASSLEDDNCGHSLMHKATKRMIERLFQCLQVPGFACMRVLVPNHDRIFRLKQRILHMYELRGKKYAELRGKKFSQNIIFPEERSVSEASILSGGCCELESLTRLTELLIRKG